MPTKDGSNIANDYAYLLGDFAHGRAIYKPVLTKELKPNSLGFFDFYGDWNNIVHLNDSAGLSSAGLSAPVLNAGERDPLKRSWLQPIPSASVKGRQIKGNIGTDTSQTGLPANLSFGFEFTLEEELGAVLLTTPDVQQRRSNLPWSVIEAWGCNNTKALLNTYLAKDILRFGFCIIKDVYAVKRFALNAWRGQHKQAFFGSNAKGISILDAGLELKTYYGNSAGKWWYGEEPENSSEALVVFATGMKFQVSKSRLGSKIASGGELRSHDGKHSGYNVVPLNDTEVAEIYLEALGPAKNKDESSGDEQGGLQDFGSDEEEEEK